MTCTECSSEIRLAYRPGVFLSISVGFGLAAVVSAFWLHTFTGIVLACTLTFCSLVGVGAVWTNMIDASARVYSESKRSGVECKACGHICAVRPWSL